MREMIRLAATLVIWAVYATVTGVTLTNSTGAASRMDGGQVIALVAILTFAATISTRAIWTNHEASSTHVAQSKTKRDRPGSDRAADLSSGRRRNLRSGIAAAVPS